MLILTQPGLAPRDSSLRLSRLALQADLTDDLKPEILHNTIVETDDRKDAQQE
jgi:hypothetical protein